MNSVGKKVVPIIVGKKGKGSGSGDGGGAAPPDSDEWKAKLTRNRDHHVEGTLHNIITILENDERLKGLFWLNDFSNQLILAREAPWHGSNRSEFMDVDASELAAWLQHPDRYHMKCSDDVVLKAVIATARRYRRDPVREYLESLEWDGTPRVERMLAEIFGTDDNHYARQTSLCFMVGAVARILWSDPKNPTLGAKVDFMLVLEGNQGKKKSTSVSKLFGEQWYVETIEPPTGKDFYLIIQGAWCIEIGEMDAFSKADIKTVKMCITRRSDKFRPPYDRLPSTFRRCCVLVGTTNDSHYLRDASGARRFLPIRVHRAADVVKLLEIRDQLWAESVHLFRQGFQYWVLPDEAAAEQEDRFQEDPWQEPIERFLAGDFGENGKHRPARLDSMHIGPLAETSTPEILEFALKIEIGKHGTVENMRVANIMKHIGSAPLPDGGQPPDRWEQVRRRVDGKPRRLWVRVSAEKGGEVADAKAF